MIKFIFNIKLIKCLLCVLLIQFTLCTPVFAGNKLQSNFEKSNEVWSGPYKNFKYIDYVDRGYLIEKDYDIYLENKIHSFNRQKSLFEYLVKVQENLAKENDVEADKSYIGMAIDNVTVWLNQTQKPLPKKIDIQDKKYAKLKDDTKKAIAYYNNYYTDNRTMNSKISNSLSNPDKKLSLLSEKAFFTSLIALESYGLRINEKLYEGNELLEQETVRYILNETNS